VGGFDLGERAGEHLERGACLHDLTLRNRGTFTVTYTASAGGGGGSSTTAGIAWNATLATIKAAVAALASIIADGQVSNVNSSTFGTIDAGFVGFTWVFPARPHFRSTPLA